jgi:hypothetical protein
MVLHLTDILSIEDINYLLTLPEVSNAKAKIDQKNLGSVYFSINLTPTIKNALYQKMNLELTNIDKIPMRWIKGDTKPHIDHSVNGAHSFENTYLMYLTDSKGHFLLDNTTYPISQGHAYIFNEGLNHETINTGTEPRLLLGPMSEEGIPVGIFSISGDSSQTVYFRDNEGTVEYSQDNQETWNSMLWPCLLENNNPEDGMFKLEFLTDITLNDVSQYFVIGSTNIQIGSTSLNSDGSRPEIFISGVTGCLGLIRNGSSDSTGYNNVNVFNLEVRATNGSTLANNAGWIGQINFAKGATSNYIINCSSDGPIGSNSSQGGGIVGSFVGSDNGELTIIGCSSSGDIGINSGGIVATYAGNTGATPSPANGGIISCISCWSTGNIAAFVSGTSAGGGIYGEYAGDGANASATNCYSEGSIGNRCGGIFGRFAGRAGSAVATNCYSRGNIATDAGGIFGIGTGYTGGSTSATNCYSSGTITTPGNGIIGGSRLNYTVTNCYSADGSWSTSTANSSLTGYPEGSNKIGETWIASVLNQPYELKNMGYQPYGLQNIHISSSPYLIRSYPIYNTGYFPEKDMSNQNYTEEFDPYDYQNDFFPGMADFIDANIELGDKNEGDRLTASYWDDLGNDVFDDWGYFYLYDVSSGKYYFPLFEPQNQGDGIMTTQTFNAFGRTFTIIHGWADNGIFKFDISVADALPFRFGAYGNMGSDGDEVTDQLTYLYKMGGNDKTLYYHRHAESGNEFEQLYSYFIPKNNLDNNNLPYEIYYNSDDMNMMTKAITTGVTIYYAKSYDVKDWVVNEIKNAADEVYSTIDISGGSSYNAAIVSGKSYTILQKMKDGVVADLGNTITIDPSSGVISTTVGTIPGTYSIYIRNNGSYNLSVLNFNVVFSGPIPCLMDDTQVLTPNGYLNITKLKVGDLVLTSDKRKVKIVDIFETNVPGNINTYPCLIKKNSIARNYPPRDFRISRDHLIKFENYWICPKLYYSLDKTLKVIKYYHIKLNNYITDHLVINNGVVVESLGNHPFDNLEKKRLYSTEYIKRIKSLKNSNNYLDVKKIEYVI